MAREEDVHAQEISYTKKDGSVDLKALCTGVMQRFLGKALDYARISGMSDRSFTQFQRSLKDDFYQIMGFEMQILKESGHIPSDQD